MPVDLSSAGCPSVLPRRPRFWPWWFCIWFACNVIGVAIAMLLWPKGQPASGAKFWFDFVGISNGIFVALAGIERFGYEVLWYRATRRNLLRSQWLAQRARTAQRPLQVLGVGYCLPLRGKVLAEVLAGRQSLLKMQSARHGSGKVLCNRFEDNDGLLAGQTMTDDDVEGVLTQAAPAVQMIRVALEPLAASLQALARYEKGYWPQVRVLAEPESAEPRLAQVREALRLAALPPLEVQAVPASDGLLVADAWLDAREFRPLLVVAVTWYDDRIDEGSGEGCAAMLLDPGYFRLPPEVRPKASLHRPVLGRAGDAEAGFMVTAIWGKTDPAAVKRAWITRPVEHCDRALDAAGFQATAKDAGQFRPDRIVGDIGAANGLLAIAAAIESGAADGPHFIIDGLQSAVLHVTPTTNDKTTG
ncbi:MAG TPA: hypothetical protein VJS30_31205 [Paraburkholderia sp.]|nr:hypothetical protein [Paraburkholderia sp.]